MSTPTFSMQIRIQVETKVGEYKCLGTSGKLVNDTIHIFVLCLEAILFYRMVLYLGYMIMIDID